MKSSTTVAENAASCSGPTGRPPRSSFVKAGVLDDLAALDHLRPAAEIYTCRHAAWYQPLDGA
ncbi:hypothetical protein CORC01_07307 [Colletotrichum orchidophilum]|uniref:Uncharacterized protein n=1 Tax=Colletotrichum orchidophilum TaxID=1209926 RepID=A0A1G4B800_9PEZI|nr:uncharacterized protein CORC01_07307 [Colletotrichum orchidophilum]OHE97402.1 hypothetical protein CORC01_07307 [Colletotrichum orchidophilum]